MVVHDNQSATHEELECLNIYVYQLGRSLVNKGWCTKTYAWSHAYYTLTDKGIESLRALFGLPAEAAPLTLSPAKVDTIERKKPMRENRNFNNRGGQRGGKPGRRPFQERRPREENPQ